MHQCSKSNVKKDKNIGLNKQKTSTTIGRQLLGDDDFIITEILMIDKTLFNIAWEVLLLWSTASLTASTTRCLRDICNQWPDLQQPTSPAKVWKRQTFVIRPFLHLKPWTWCRREPILLQEGRVESRGICLPSRIWERNGELRDSA